MRPLLLEHGSSAGCLMPLFVPSNKKIDVSVVPGSGNQMLSMQHVACFTSSFAVIQSFVTRENSKVIPPKEEAGIHFETGGKQAPLTLACPSIHS
jgi:hypothetical protein